MALKSASGIDYRDQVISIRIQELDPKGNGRPYEEDLVDEGLCADSIADIPLVGDYISLDVDRLDRSKGEERWIKSAHMFKILSRYFSLAAMIKDNYSINCNLVVELVTDEKVMGKLVKD